MHAFTDFYVLATAVEPINETGAMNVVYGAGDTILIGW